MDTDEKNPGEEIKNIIKNIIPKTDDFLIELDRMLDDNDQLFEIFYESSINYVTRRLISLAISISKENDQLYGEQTNDEDTQQITVSKDERLRGDLRKAIAEVTNLESKTNIDQLVTLLFESIKCDNRIFLSKKKRKIRNSRKDHDTHCYICGKELDYDLQIDILTKSGEIKQVRDVQIEHLWPRALGGRNKDFNFKISCYRCNQTKASFIDASDFHYEHIHGTNNNVSENFLKEWTPEKRLSIKMKQDFKCYDCGKSVTEVGDLKLKRLNLNDSWHFLNVIACCDYCTENYK